MNATSFARSLDRKEKAKKSSLQWLFSANANDGCGYRISDKRDAGVCLNQNIKNENQENRTGFSGNRHDKNNNDGLLGCLLLDSLFDGLLSAAFHGVNIVSLSGAVDDVWMDRRKPAAPPAEPSYFAW